MATDKELLHTAREWRRGALSTPPFKGSSGAMLCFVITAPLQGWFLACGVECSLVKGTVDLPNELWEHYWIGLPDGRIIDPTASQFNDKGRKKMPTVYLGPLPGHYSVDTPNSRN